MTKPSRFFVGRGSELQSLRRYAQKAFSGQGLTIGLKGPPGSGKSTLLLHFIEELEGLKENLEVLIGQCIDSEAMPYLPFVEAMRKHFRISGIDQAVSVERVRHALLGIGEDVVGLAPIVGPLLTVGVSVARHTAAGIAPSQLEVRAGQDELFYGISQVLLAIARKKKIVLTFEDMHWADRSSLHLLQYLTGALRDRPILILLTFRPDVQADQPSPFSTVWNRLLQKDLAHEVLITNFNADEFDEYLARAFRGQTVGEDVKEALFAQTGGNPLFLSQVLPALLREKLLVREGRVWKRREYRRTLTIPPSIEASVQETLQVLAPETQTALEVAAVIGKRFEYPILASASNMPELDLDQQLDILIVNQVLTEVPETIDVYEFIHAIVRDIVYRRIATRRRRRVHLSIAQTIEQIYHANKWEVFETLAYHYQRGGNMAKAIEFYLDAANKAISLLAYDEALRSYQHVLELLGEDDPRFLNMLEIAGKLADRTSQWQLARTYFERLLKLATKANDLRKMGEAHEGIAMVHFRQGRWAEAERSAHEHQHIAKEVEDDGERASALFNLGQVYWRTGRWQEAQTALQEALQIQEKQRLYERIPATITVLGVVLRNQGQYNKALELYQRGIDLHEEHRTLDQYWLGRIYNNKGTVLRSIAAEEDARGTGPESSYWDQAVAAYKKSLDIMCKIGSLRDISNTYNNLALVYKTRCNCDLKEAMTYCHKAKQHLSDIDAPVDLLDALRVMGAIQVQLGHFEEGRKNLEESLAIANRIGAPYKVALAYMEIGTLHRKRQLQDKARKYYELAREGFAAIGPTPRLEELDLLLRELDA